MPRADTAYHDVCEKFAVLAGAAGRVRCRPVYGGGEQ